MQRYRFSVVRCVAVMCALNLGAFCFMASRDPMGERLAQAWGISKTIWDCEPIVTVRKYEPFRTVIDLVDPPPRFIPIVVDSGSWIMADAPGTSPVRSDRDGLTSLQPGELQYRLAHVLAQRRPRRD